MLLVGLLGGCAARPINPPITQVDPTSGYRPQLLIPKRPHNDPNTLFVLSFSGGGTRAAALSYGLLEELRKTYVDANGTPRRLIDEVDVITGVSGGSFTALSYALLGDRLFSEYEDRFLKRNVQGALARRIFLNPINWWRLLGRHYGRTELAADYYDEILFEGATFADLVERAEAGPVAIATATDISTGSRLAFFQNDFDLLCSDLDPVRLSRAAATSSAVPILLSAATFNNYGGTCSYEYPLWVKDVANPERSDRPSVRALQRYREMQDFQNSNDRPFLHLVDGGVSDNIGVRGVMEALEELAASAAFQGQVGFGAIQNIVLILVNARSSPSTNWDKRETAPGLVAQLLQSSGVPIARYSFETVETLKDRAEVATWRRELRIAQARLAGMSREEAEEQTPNVVLRVLDVTFDSIENTAERERFMNMPTSFVLTHEQVDQLREIAGRLLEASPAYDGFIGSLGGIAEAESCPPR